MVPRMNQASESTLQASPANLEGLRAVSPSASAREARLRKHADYQRVYGSSRKQFSSSMTWFLSARDADERDANVMGDAAAATTDGPRVGLTAGKVLGKAHERNRIKRRMREVVRKHLEELPSGFDLILHPRRSVMTMDFAKLDAEVLRIFRQAAAQASGASLPVPRNSAR
jgi:ribonuclease P protein component